MPAYWLGAFFYPRGLLALLKQDAYRHHNQDRSGNIDNFVFQTEITARDKDHVSAEILVLIHIISVAIMQLLKIVLAIIALFFVVESHLSNFYHVFVHRLCKLSTSKM